MKLTITIIINKDCFCNLPQIKPQIFTNFTFNLLLINFINESIRNKYNLSYHKALMGLYLNYSK